MSWYSINALVVLRSLDTFVREKLHKLIKQTDNNQQSTDKQLKEIQKDLDVLSVQTKESFDVINSSLQQQQLLLNELLALSQKQTTTLSVVFKFEDGHTQNSLGGLQMKITDVQSVTATAVETDAKGNPVVLDPTKLVWASADESKVSVTQNHDGSATFAAVGPLTIQPDGSDPGVQVSVTDGNLTQVDFIQVINSAATSIGINFGTPA